LITELRDTNKQLQTVLAKLDIETLQRNPNSTLQRYETVAVAVNDRHLPDDLAELIAEIRVSNKVISELMCAGKKTLSVFRTA
jgi:hypothetical protein